MGNTKIIDCNKYHNSYTKISNLKILAYNKTDKYLNVTYSFSNLIIFTYLLFLQISNSIFLNKITNFFLYLTTINFMISLFFHIL